MPTTYEYKVRDRAGNLVSGELIGDSEGLVMTKLREMGMTPIQVKKAKTGLKMEINLRPKVKSAMTYPVVVVLLVMLILSAMLLFVVPQFKSIYDQLGGSLPLPTQILLAASNAGRTYWYVFLLLVFGTALAFRRYKKTDRGRAQMDAVKLRIPVFGGLFHKTALARFSSTLGMLLRSGVPILQALDIVADTVNNRVISRAVGDVQGAV